MSLWNNEIEVQFFQDALKSFASKEKLFYKLKERYFAYIPKESDAKGQTLQSRNSLIGQFTEKWCKTLFEPIAKELNLYAINGVVCNEIGLTRQSSADLAFCAENSAVQKPENIKLIFEIKMSIVSNYECIQNEKNEYKIKWVGDYKKHKGNPSLLRSDSMLKAIGKSINIRVSGVESAKIPIVVLGNSPITDFYIKKVDFLKTSGVIQGFWSLNPQPTDSDFIKETPMIGFQTILNEDDLFNKCKKLIGNEMNYFSSMISKKELGEIIKIASKEKTDIERAEKFLNMIRGQK
ncbi:MAG TPA: hypothetical protein PLF21_05595 [Exilispira sp.]|nr:hypothetical protein [Exilispira sp.]